MMNKKGEGQKQFVISLVLITLFSFAIIGFATQFASDNSASVDISDDSQITGVYTNANSNLTGFSSDSEDSYTSIVETTISSQSGSAQSVAPFTLTTGNALGTTKNIIKVGYIKIFGSDNAFGIFMTAFISVLVFIAGLFLYKTLRGQPD